MSLIKFGLLGWGIICKFATRVKVNADGWCLARAVNDLKLESEIACQIDGLISFVTNDSVWNCLFNENDLMELALYKDNKKWDSNVVDLMPAIWSDFLKISLLVLVNLR